MVDLHLLSTVSVRVTIQFYLQFLGPKDCEITCCVDMQTSDVFRQSSLRNSNERGINGRYLAVGLSDGRVCLFNIFSSRVVRCVYLGSRVTALTFLTSTTSVPRFLCEELLLFHGLVAVGSQGGQVTLLDFSLDEDSPTDPTSDENSPSQPFFIDLSGGAEKVAQQRSTASHRGQHISIPLHDIEGSKKKKTKVFSFTDSLTGETTQFLCKLFIS